MLHHQPPTAPGLRRGDRLDPSRDDGVNARPKFGPPRRAVTVVVQTLDEVVCEVGAMPDIHFNAHQYLTAVGRAQRDQSWETPQRQVARLVYEELASVDALIPPNLELRFATPAWGIDGLAVDVVFMNTSDDPDRFEQQILRLTSQHEEASIAAAQMTQCLLNELPDTWIGLFGYDPTVGGR